MQEKSGGTRARAGLDLVIGARVAAAIAGFWVHVSHQRPVVFPHLVAEDRVGEHATALCYAGGAALALLGRGPEPESAFERSLEKDREALAVGTASGVRTGAWRSLALTRVARGDWTGAEAALASADREAVSASQRDLVAVRRRRVAERFEGTPEEIAAARAATRLDCGNDRVGG